MSETNKSLSAELNAVLEGMPEDVQASLMKDWTAEARGAKKVCDMSAESQPA